MLTEIGETFAGRMAASLLTALGLEELITTTSADYAALAIALGRDPPRLQALKQKLKARRDESALFDTKAFTRHIETAYRLMMARADAGLAPDHLSAKAFP